MARYFLRRRKSRQNGVNAIFSGKVQRESIGSRSEFLLSEDESFGITSREEATRGSDARSRFLGSSGKLARTVVALFLIGLGFSLITGAFFIDSSSIHAASPGPAGPGPGSIVSFPRIAPSFYAISNTPEKFVLSGGSYLGSSATTAGDFLVVQVAYSEGSPGNLPDLATVQDTLSTVYTREGSASPGVGANFWEQMWIARVSASISSANITVTPDWKNCPAPCVSSIIITMSIARYRNVASVGSMIAIAPNASSTSQAANIPIAGPGSILVELLSHGAYNNCQGDAAQPISGQTSRNCYTGTTERVELFDHLVPSSQAYNESYLWSQLEVQRGIYLVLNGK